MSKAPESPGRPELAAGPTPTPQERLAASRKAIVRHMSKDKPPVRDHEQPYELEDASVNREEKASFWPSAAGRALQTWWRQHPFSMAVDVARPVLGRYAQNQPLKLLGIAAAIGAAAVLVRPWRLISVGGIALAAVKSAAVPSVLMSIFSSSDTSYSTSTDTSDSQARRL